MSHEQTGLESCWFCANSRSDEQASAEVRMHKVADNKDMVITVQDGAWESATVHIPRCIKCKAVHERTERYVQRGALLGLLIGVLLAGLIFLFLFPGFFIMIAFVIMVAVVGGIIGWAIGRAFSPEGVRDQGLAATHANVRRKEEEGWKVGGQPAGGRRL
jgi:predicted lipid-binding transport protein (Tim44 family)